MSNSWPDSAIMMTLSGIAYSSDIGGQLQNTNYATQGDWSLVWGPVNNNYGNLAYVVKSASTGKYALVIRGSETRISIDTLWNWFYNFSVATQNLWPYLPTQPQARVSYGAWVQASALTESSWFGKTLGTFLTKDIPPGTPIAVTGHSLGGNLASVLASWISYWRGPEAGQPDPNTEVYTFAAPSAGNQQFSTGFNARFSNSYRYWNTLDVVPRAWDQLLSLNSIYQGIGIPTPHGIKDIVDALEVALVASELYWGSFYEQTNSGGNALPGNAVPSNVDYLLEAAYQHGVNVYLGLLKAPLIQSTLLLEVGAAAQPGSFLPRPVIDPRQLQAQLQDGLAQRPLAGVPNLGPIAVGGFQPESGRLQRPPLF
jgi:triacylglycerol lipase